MRRPPDLSLSGFLALAEERLILEPIAETTLPHLSPLKGDHDLNEALIARLDEPPPPLKAAAVLVPVIQRGTELFVILTQRPEHMTSHAGQVAFPGGKVDQSDASALAAALREAHEEIGLEPALVRPLGSLDIYQTGSGYRILPVVALVDPSFTAKPNPHEVAVVFEVPLTFLVDRTNHIVEESEWRGNMWRYYSIPYGERYIWGATAGMIRNLSERLDPPC